MSNFTVSAEPGKQEIVMTRVFDAPRELVFKTYVDPNLIGKWWGPESFATTVDAMEPRTGGKWRFVNKDPEGNEYAFHGVYHEVEAPQRVIFTFEFEGLPEPGHVLLETVMFFEQDGKTTMRDKLVFQSVEDRDGMLLSGMEQGAAETMNRFEEVLRTLLAELPPKSSETENTQA